MDTDSNPHQEKNRSDVTDFVIPEHNTTDFVTAYTSRHKIEGVDDEEENTSEDNNFQKIEGANFSSKFFNGTLFLIAIVLAWWIGHTRLLDDYIGSDRSTDDSLKRSPYLNEKNASNVVKSRQTFIQSEFEAALANTEWKPLRSSTNISIETLEALDGWPPYIRTTAFIPCSPEDVFDAFKWSNFHKTQSAIDPFYQSSEVVLEGNKFWRIIRKTTKRPLMFPKREFFLATIDSKSTNNLYVNYPSSEQKTNKKVQMQNEAVVSTDTPPEKMMIPKGSLMSILVSVRITEAMSKQGKIGVAEREKERYVHSYQDFVGWFVRVPGGTKLTIVMRVDIGPDIPRWAFMTLVTATGIPAIRSLIKYVTLVK